MPHTFFKEFTSASGQPVTVEYQMEDETCAAILNVWPNTREYNDIRNERTELEVRGNYGLIAGRSFISDLVVREELVELDRLIEDMDESARLPQSDIEQMERWLSENHVQTSDIAF